MPGGGGERWRAAAAGHEQLKLPFNFIKGITWSDAVMVGIVVLYCVLTISRNASEWSGQKIGVSGRGLDGVWTAVWTGPCTGLDKGFWRRE